MVSGLGRLEPSCWEGLRGAKTSPGRRRLGRAGVVVALTAGAVTGPQWTVGARWAPAASRLLSLRWAAGARACRRGQPGPLRWTPPGSAAPCAQARRGVRRGVLGTLQQPLRHARVEMYQLSLERDGSPRPVRRTRGSCHPRDNVRTLELSTHLKGGVCSLKPLQFKD